MQPNFCDRNRANIAQLTQLTQLTQLKLGQQLNQLGGSIVAAGSTGKPKQKIRKYLIAVTKRVNKRSKRLSDKGRQGIATKGVETTGNRN